MARISESTTQEIKPRCEILKEDVAPILSISLPGFKKDEVKVRVQGAELTIKGMRDVGSNRKEHFEVCYGITGSFSIKEIKAMFKDEKLTISMPKMTALFRKYPLNPDMVENKQQEKVDADTIARRQEEERVREERSRIEQEQLLDRGKEHSKEAKAESPKKGSSPGNVVADDIPKTPAAAEEKSSGNAEEKDFTKKDGCQPLASEAKGSRVVEVPGHVDGKTAGNLEYIRKKSTGVGEDRVLLVNTAMALLILAALTAYISYTAWPFA